MISKIKQISGARKSRYVAIAAAFALTVASLGTFMAPQKAAAYYNNCITSPHQSYVCSPSIEQCLAYKPYLYMGVQNQAGCVVAIQGFLRSLGFKLAVDGKFGPETHGNVKYYQALTKQTMVDGKIGSQTWAQITRDCTRVHGTTGEEVCKNTWAYYE